MVTKQIISNIDIQKKVLPYVKLYEDSVVCTLGPGGNRVLIDDGTTPIVTKDGVTVCKSISFKDPVGEAIIKILKESALKSNKEAGDGTTSTTLLSCELVKAGFKLLDKGFSSNKIIKGMELAKEHLIESLKTSILEINEEDDLRKVAMVSSNGDEEISDIVMQAFSSITDNGVVLIQDSFNEKTFVQTTEGLEIPKGYISSTFINNESQKTWEAENPYILVSYKEITKIDLIYQLLNKVNKEGKPLLIIAPKIDDEVRTIISNNVVSGNLNACIIQTPGFNKALFEENTEDLSIALNCEGVFKKDLEALTTDNIEKYLGTSGKVIVNVNKTTFIDIPETETLTKHIESLKTRLTDCETDSCKGYSAYELDKIKERLARLDGGVATIFVGGTTKIELIEKKHRYEDAVNSVRSALRKGVLPGAGIALFKTSLNTTKAHKKEIDKLEPNIKAGYQLLMEQCSKVFCKVLENIGHSEEEILQYKMAIILGLKKQFFEGPHTSNYEKTINYYDYGILDPYIVVEQSILNSVSVASSILSSRCMLVKDMSNVNFEAADANVMENQ